MLGRCMTYTALSFLLLLGMPSIAVEPLTWGVSIIEPWGPNPTTPDAPNIGSDIIEELAQRTGQPMKIIVEPYARVLKDLTDDSLDFALVYRTPGAEAYSAYPACMFTVPVIAIARKGFHLKSFADLANLRQGIGVVRGVAYGDAFDNDPSIVKSIESDFPQMLRKLLAGRLDGIAGSTVMILHNTQLDGADAILGDRIPLGTVEACVQVPKSRADLPITARVAAATRAMMAEGRFEAIVSRYVGPNWQ